MGPHPYPTIVRDFQRVIGDEAAAQVKTSKAGCRTSSIACVGGGSNAIGLFSRFIGEPSVRLVAVEAAGDGIETGHHAAAIAARAAWASSTARERCCCRTVDGQITEAHSISAGLDYPGVGPQLSALAAEGRLELASSTDTQALAALRLLARTRGHPARARTGARNCGAAAVVRNRVRLARRCRAVWPRRQGHRPPGGAGMTRDTLGSRRIQQAFAAAKAEGRLAFIPYVVAGYPDASTSETAALAALDAGADLLEIGLPYSDPLADGVTLQRASAAALGEWCGP